MQRIGLVNRWKNIYHNYTNIRERLMISTVESAREITDLIFSFKILNDYIVCEKLLESFNFFVPTRIPRYNLQYFKLPILNYGKKYIDRVY